MAVRKFTAPADEVTILSTEMNALADDDLCNGTTIFDNTTNRRPHMIAEMDFGANLDLSAGNSGPACHLYLIPSYDGTNYADDGELTNELVPGGYCVGSFYFNKEATARRAIIDVENVLGPIKYKATIFNDLGTAFPATGVTVKMKSYQDDIS